ncbi:hypothetical protein GCM10027160_16830 [Streptomyces calidiresistens]|uniref:hypothetical protein n=1 Tax=Streptomyces calidiresistens TaxID=1485586 RepID=UPI001E30D56F|nr:hypothetical protein [Streptomyces calidiresistens]
MRTVPNGGHNEPANRYLRDAVVPLSGYEDVPLDIDVYTIDANPSKKEPAHHHVNFGWAFQLGTEYPVTLQEEEIDGHEGRAFASAASPTVRAKLAQLT